MVLGIGALNTGSYSRCTSVCCLDHIAGKIVVRHNGASNGSYADGLSFDAQFIDYLSHQAVYDTVGTAGTIMHRRICQRMGFIKYYH
jgi:prepilin-type processing-associated H-X9-DG protein